MLRIAIIGGGASGFMAAITAAERFGKAAEVVLFEKSKSVLGKVRISGGGRCNVTHDEPDKKRFAQQYPRGKHFMKKVLPRFDMFACVEWFSMRGVELKTEADGRMFPTTDDSATIVNCLISAAQKARVHIRTSTGVRGFEIKNSSGANKFQLQLQNGNTYTADKLLIASGGHPKTIGYQWLMKHGIQIEDPVPSLFTFNAPGCPLRNLLGISMPDIEASIINTKLKYRGPLLLTHWGFSGPAILKLSAWGARVLQEKAYRFDLRINWLPDWKDEALRAFLYRQKEVQAKRQIGKYPLFEIPQRLWHVLLEQTSIEKTKIWIDLSKKELNRLIETLLNSVYLIHGKSTFKEEFVTAGGVQLSDINPKTMEHRNIQGLFFSGEILNIDGITGGFNFQAAWCTGYIAGQYGF